LIYIFESENSNLTAICRIEHPVLIVVHIYFISYRTSYIGRIHNCNLSVINDMSVRNPVIIVEHIYFQFP